MTWIALAFTLGLLVGRLSKRERKPARISSQSYFHHRPDVYPVLAHWSQDVAEHIRAQRGQ